MTPTDFNAKFADFTDGQFQPQDPNPTKPADNPPVPRFKRSEYQVTEVVCEQGDFAVGKTSDGKCVALWRSHVYLAQDDAELSGVLNATERALLPQ